MSAHDTHKQKLEAELAIVRQQLQDLGIQNPTVSEDWIATPQEPVTSEADENIVADRKEDWIEEHGEVAVLETRFNNINRALKAIEVGTYGICSVCSQPITSERLAANPAATTCIDHADASEIG